MGTVPVHNLGRLGVVADLSDHTIPPEAWSSANNVRFRKDKVIQVLTDREVFATPTVAPKWAFPALSPTSLFWLYSDHTKMYVFDGTVHTNITRQTAAVDVDYSATDALLWNGGTLGGIPVINNGVDVPQFWAQLTASQKLQDLTNWNANWKTKIIRPFKAFLIALSITKSGVVSPHMVKWSHPADPGTVPVSWDEADATKDAGEKELSDSEAGIIRDGLRLGDLFIIYKDNATHGMQFIGGRFIFRIFPIADLTGILTTKCVTPTPDGKMHFVVTQDDVIIHDVQTIKSVVDNKVRELVFDSLDRDNLSKNYCFTNIKDKECWFCYSTAGATVPNTALVWSARDNNISFRSLDSYTYIARGTISEGVASIWNSDTEIWDTDTSKWDEPSFSDLSVAGLACKPSATKFFKIDGGSGTGQVSYIERTGLAIVGRDRLGQPKVDLSSRKLVTRLWPKVTGGPVKVRIGGQEEVGGAVTWLPFQTFTPGTSLYLDFVINTRLMAIRFEGLTSDIQWTLSGYDLELKLVSQL